MELHIDDLNLSRISIDTKEKQQQISRKSEIDDFIIEEWNSGLDIRCSMKSSKQFNLQKIQLNQRVSLKGSLLAQMQQMSKSVVYDTIYHNIYDAETYLTQSSYILPQISHKDAQESINKAQIDNTTDKLYIIDFQKKIPNLCSKCKQIINQQ